LQLIAAALQHSLARAEELGAAEPAAVGSSGLDLPSPSTRSGYFKGASGLSQHHMPSSFGPVHESSMEKKRRGWQEKPGSWVDDIPLATRWVRDAAAVLSIDPSSESAGASQDAATSFAATMQAARKLARRELKRVGLRQGTVGARWDNSSNAGLGAGVSALAPTTRSMLRTALADCVALRAVWPSSASDQRSTGLDGWAQAREDSAAALSAPALRE